MDDLATHLTDALRFSIHWALVIAGIGNKVVVPPVNDDILLLSATSLASHIREGKLTSRKIVKSYIERIKEVQPFINGLAEDRFELALKEAALADESIASGQMTRDQMAKEKPLLGVPFTVKIMIAVEGMPFNGGCSLFKDKKSDLDSNVVQTLKGKGAIVLGTTNMPEMALNMLSDGKVYGRVKNPFDSRMFPGASSSGEAVLNAAAATPFGVGNDLFGSIRIPCFLCGLFGHRPSCGLLPKQLMFPETSEKTTKMLVVGPICRYAEDLITFMKAVLAPQQIEHMGIGEPVDFSKITIYYTHSFPEKHHAGMMEIDVEILWIIQQVTNYFKAKFGTSIKYVKLDELVHSLSIWSMEMKMGFESTLGNSLRVSGGFSSDTKEFFKSLFGKSALTLCSLFAYTVAKNITSSYRIYPKTQRRFRTLGDKLQNMLNGGQSVLLYPTFHKKSIYVGENPLSVNPIIYNGIFSLFKMPVTQCPVSSCDEGPPLGIQVIGGMNCDNLTMAMAVEIEKGFRETNYCTPKKLVQ